MFKLNFTKGDLKFEVMYEGIVHWVGKSLLETVKGGQQVFRRIYRK